MYASGAYVFPVLSCDTYNFRPQCARLEVNHRESAYASLRDSATGTGLAGKPLTFWTKPRGPEPVCTSTTDYYGGATCSDLRIFTGAGFIADFAGDAAYLPSSTEAHTIGLGVSVCLFGTCV